MNKIIIITFCLFATLTSLAQTTGSERVKIKWLADFEELGANQESTKKPFFRKAFYPTPSSLPEYIFIKAINGTISSASIKTKNEVYQTVTKDYDYLDNYKTSPYTIIKKSGNTSIVECHFPTFNFSNGTSEQLVSFDFELKYKRNETLETNNRRQTRSTNNSKLATGNWYKILVRNTGVQLLNQAFFNNAGISLAGVNPQNIRVFGYAEGMLPENPISNVPATLPEIPTFIQGGGDGVFNTNDYLLFFAKGTNVWEWSESSEEFNHEKHLYTDSVYYYINIGNETRKSIAIINQTASPSNLNITTYEYHDFHETDNTNLIKTGKEWYGDYFDISNKLKHSFNFNFPNKSANSKIIFKARTAVRSTVSGGNNLIFRANGAAVSSSTNINAISTFYTANYARVDTKIDSFNLNSENLNFEIEYGYPASGSVAWLDYLEVKAECNLDLSRGPIYFSQPKSIGPGNVSKFSISNANNQTTVWDVTDPYNTFAINGDLSGTVYTFKAETDTLRKFMAFNNSGFSIPTYISKQPNQNLLSLVDKEYVIITTPEFQPYAQQLASFHANIDGLSSAVVILQDIYNEFSNSHQDITAIRNFIQYLYNNASSNEARIKYVMLFGDGSYDPRNRVFNNKDIIPTFQSQNSISPTASFTSDDYYVMLDDANGIYSSSSSVDIGLGRFPARNIVDAQSFVNKVKRYVNSNQLMSFDGLSGTDVKSTFADWKNNLLFVADDGSTADNYTTAHMSQTELIVDALLQEDSSFNINKVYLDAYAKQSTAGGGRYPDVNTEIRVDMNQGQFFTSYIGHGGEVGWADERVLTVNEILAWDNIDGLPLFVTATCEFSRYDDPERTAAGEHVILNPNGGAISMLTTTRLVYGGISNNIGFSINFFDAALNEFNGDMPRLGDIIKLTKENSPLGTNFNNRKFALLGDPAMKLAYPKYNVVTTSINGHPLNQIDTLKALSKVRIEGEIQDKNGNPSNLNGFVYPEVYDKLQEVKTLDNNNKGTNFSFQTRNSLLYKGVSTVENGQFSFEFVVPKDINYTFGNGRISYYFANDTVDGKGYTERVIIGGSSSDFVDDNEGPVVKLFLNDSNFIFGGTTDENPLIYALISDSNGINTSGTSLGHDLAAVLDDDFSNPIILNSFYRANLNDFTNGKVSYPLNDLTEGTHTLSLKAWDVNNNSGTGYTEFIVSKNAKLALDRVLNYPNPFTTSTNFYFEHNQTNENLLVNIQIFTISGKVIKTINTSINTAGNLKPSPIKWDGLDEYGDKIGRGVYIYQVEIKNSTGDSAKKLEKLVILQ